MSKRSFVKKLAAAAMCGVLALGALGMTACSASDDSSSAATSSKAPAAAASQAVKAPVETSTYTGKHHAKLVVEGYEPVTIELDADSAPITVSNFIDLVQDGYYDGKTFYRIQDGFCLQGGTLGNSASGNDPSLTPVVGEFSSNGYDNPLADAFDYGTVAMARTQVPDSATSTFFVTLGPHSMVGTSLDGKYAAFGTIDAAGMQTIDKIIKDYLGKVDPTSQMGAITNEADQPVIQSITILD